MVSDKLEAKLNELLNGEMEAHHVYTHAAAWASAHKFEGSRGSFSATPRKRWGTC